MTGPAPRPLPLVTIAVAARGPEGRTYAMSLNLAPPPAYRVVVCRFKGAAVEPVGPWTYVPFGP